MKEETFQKLAEGEFAHKTNVDKAAVDAGIKSLTDLIANETTVEADNGLYLTGKLDVDMSGVLVTMKIPAQRIRWQYFVECEVAAPAATDELKQDGPTVEEYVKAGYLAKNYPPAGYASKSSEDEIAAAVASQEQDNGAHQDADSQNAADALLGIDALLEREKANDPTLTADDKAKLAAYHEANPAPSA